MEARALEEDDAYDPWADSGDDSDDGVRAERAEMERQAAVMEKRLGNLGYQAGLEAGRDAAAEEGFLLGMREGHSWGLRFGRAVGAVSVAVACAGERAAAVEERLHAFKVAASALQAAVKAGSDVEEDSAALFEEAAAILRDLGLATAAAAV